MKEREKCGSVRLCWVVVGAGGGKYVRGERERDPRKEMGEERGMPRKGIEAQDGKESRGGEELGCR